MSPDFEREARRLMTPARPRLDEARAAVAAATDPESAWEALASHGLIPHRWIDDPARAFRRGPGGPKQHGGTRDTTRYARPPSIDGCVALAADAGGVAAAEALAAEFLARAAPIVPPASRRIVWRVGGSVAQHLAPERVFLEAIREAHGSLSIHSDAPAPPYEVTTGRSAAASRWLGTHHAAAQWASGRLHGATLPDGRKMTDAADPIEPLLEIWRIGYALDDIDADEVPLIAPALDAARQTEPLEELLHALDRFARPPSDWRAEHAPDGDLRALWRTCDDPRVLVRIGAAATDARTFTRVVCACARLAYPRVASAAYERVFAAAEAWAGGRMTDEALAQAPMPARRRLHLPDDAATACYLTRLPYEDPLMRGMTASAILHRAAGAVGGSRSKLRDGLRRLLPLVRDGLSCPTLDQRVDARTP